MLKNNRQAVTFLPLCIMVLLLAVFVSSAAAKAPKYLFLFIGDGMGILQRTAANEYMGKKLLMDTFPYQGITTTHAAFYAHVPARGQYYDIDVALAESGFDYFGGGMTLGFAGTRYQTYFDVLKGQKISFRQFTDEIVASFHKKDVTPSFEDMKPYITDYFGLKFKGKAGDPMVLANHEITRIIEAYQRSMNKEEEKSNNPRTYLMYGGYDPLSVTLTHILNQKGGIARTSYKHTGVPVTTSAVGLNAQTFQGMYDNTDIALKIMDIMGLGTTAKYAATAQ